MAGLIHVKEDKNLYCSEVNLYPKCIHLVFIWSKYMMLQEWSINPQRAVYKTLGLVRLRPSPLHTVHSCPPEKWENLCHVTWYDMISCWDYVSKQSADSLSIQNYGLLFSNQNCLDGHCCSHPAKVLHLFWPHQVCNGVFWTFRSHCMTL